MSFSNVENEVLANEIQKVVDDLKSQGIKAETTEHEVVGLGDIVEKSLNKLGITQQRFKEFFSLKECNCTERKDFLNKLFSWKLNKGK
jgi:predicted flap endonuclease-1-like 5' DNA nuclease